MKKRVLCVVLAALLALAMCAPAMASGEDFFETAWEMALVLKDAAAASFYAELELTWTDPAWQQDGVTPGISLEANTANFSDGYMISECEYEFGEPNQEWDDQGLAVMPGTGVCYAQEFSNVDEAGEVETYEIHDTAESTAMCDVSRAYLYFAALGDNTVGTQLAQEEEGSKAVFSTGGDGLRLLLETCFPQAVLGCADTLDWENITASARVRLDPYGDNSYIVLESPSLGAALLAQVPGMEQAQDVELELEIDIEAISAGMEEEAGYVYDNMHPDPTDQEGFVEAEGPAPQMQPLVEYIRAAYGRATGVTEEDPSRNEAKDAIRDELAGLTGGSSVTSGSSSVTGGTLSGEDAMDAIRDELAGLGG